LAIIHGKANDLKNLASAASMMDSSEVAAASDSIVKTSNRAIKILRGLRGFARDSAQDPPELVSIYQVVDLCLELQQGRFERHQIDFQLGLPQDIPPVLCREVQIEQILTNLLNNAIDAIVQSESAQRWIVVTGTCSPTEVQIDVTDSGPGIEAHFRDHLMEPFFTTKAIGLGMGIGLSLSRAIAEDHGGSLTLLLDTTHTCFRLILPYPLDRNVNPIPRMEGTMHGSQ
jgi:C4-dicarboxylate-specific signal transduction histidine kinase